MSAAYAIGQAIVTRLRGDTALQVALGGSPGDTRVYPGRAPNPDALPYVTVGEIDGAPGGPAAVFGEEANADVQTVRAWGATEWDARRIGGLVEAALKAPLALDPADGYAAVRVREQSYRTQRDPDGLAVQYLMRYHADTRAVTT